jgi:hypothetical protein
MYNDASSNATSDHCGRRPAATILHGVTGAMGRGKVDESVDVG